MAVVKQLAARGCWRATSQLSPVTMCISRGLTKKTTSIGASSYGQNLSRAAAFRGFCSMRNPYESLGVDRNASDADIKKAYREKALKWHPDKNPDNREEAQKRFAEASSAYDVLKDPESRKMYDMTGQVGGGPGMHPGGAPGGFHFRGGGNMSQADAERLFREAFGGQDLGSIFAQMFQQQGMQQHGNMGGFGGRPAQRVLQGGMEVQIHSSVDRIEKASRACGIDAENDDRRARCAGKTGMIVDTDPRDQSVKVRVMVRPGRADEVWFGAQAVEPLEEQEASGPQGHPFAGMHGMGGGSPFAGMGGNGHPGMGHPGMGHPGMGHPGMRQGQPQQRAQRRPGPQGLEIDMEVTISSDVEAIHRASRASGIDADNDDRRARCSGKIGTIVDTDVKDQSVKIRVMVKPGRADEVWFGAGAVKPIPTQGHSEASSSQHQHY